MLKILQVSFFIEFESLKADSLQGEFSFSVLIIILWKVFYLGQILIMKICFTLFTFELSFSSL